MKKIKTGFITLSIVMSQAAMAAGWSTTAKIDRIYSRSEGNVYIDFAGNGSNPDFCSKTGFYYLDKNNPAFDNIYSAILAAKYSNRAISFYLSGCQADYPKVLHSIGY